MALHVNRAMVLAAGLGTRMRPLTDCLPKPLVRFAGRALIDHVLDRLAAAGIGEAVVNVHYMAELIEAHVTNRDRPRIVISDERDALLDTGGGVVRALGRFGGEAFIIHNSDSVWAEDGVLAGQSNLDRLVDQWDDSQMDCLMLMARRGDSIGYDGRGDFHMDKMGRVARRQEGQIAPFVFAGVSIAGPRLFDGAPGGAFSLNKLWDRAIEAGRLRGVQLEGTWMHIGTPDALADAERLVGGGGNRTA